MKTKNFKVNPIRAAIIGSALMAANGAVMAAPVRTSLEFTCPFPLIGDQIIIANISADYPESIVIGANGAPVELPPVQVDAITVVPDKARQGLAFVDATTITGVAHSINTFHTAAGTIANNTDLAIVDTTIPSNESGPFDVPAAGVAPAQAFDGSHVGAVTLTVDDLIMDLRNLKADGSVAPAPVGEFSADCALNAGQDNVLTTIQVTTALADAEIEVETTAIDFGTNLLGQSATDSVTVRNIGGAILGVNAISITGADASAFSETNNCTTVDAGESCTATVTYMASEVGAQNASLVINSTDADEPSVSVTLSGTGAMEDKPEINIVATGLDFGTIEEGASTTQTILIENIGTAPLTISAVEVSNTQGTEFSVTESCFNIAAAASCSETVTFDAVEGVSAGNVVISSNDEDEATTLVSLAGAGTAVVVDPCELDPTLPECGNGGDGDLIIPVALDVAGSTYIAANRGTVPLSGVIQSEFNLTQGSFTGDLVLAPTQGSFEIIKGWSRYQATASIEFEPVGETVGTLVDGVLVATSQAYVKLPKVTKTLFGLINWKIGGGSECRTKEPVTFTITSADGEYFDALSGGVVTGEYTMSALENCGVLTSILSLKLAGPGNTINLSLTPDL
ncbi:MAG: hypothetical protein ACI84K_001402 [Pseudohongiellaceae bacterium]|jgi:hypothetical protein